MSQERTVLLVAHVGRPAAVRSARVVVEWLTAAGLQVRVLEPEAAELGCATAHQVPVRQDAAVGAEMVLVIGGDGTLLRAAELACPAGAPILGVNLGHVGFLAEAEPEVLSETVDRIVTRRYTVERRMTIDVTVRKNSHVIATTWALNEATVEKAARERMVDLVIEVDGRPLSRWSCDGVVFATPTGSTAYAFSAGGPVVWPEVEALLLVPISAHALFAGPMVVSPRSVLAAEVMESAGQLQAPGAVMWCDGRRKVDLPPGARVEVRRGTKPVLLARLRGVAADAMAAGSEPGTMMGQAGQMTARADPEAAELGSTAAQVSAAADRDAGAVESGASFTDRLVAKFGLPVTGWRGRADARQRDAAPEPGREPRGDA